MLAIVGPDWRSRVQRLMGKVAVKNKFSVPPRSKARGLSMSICKPKEVELTWILFKGLKYLKLIVLGFYIFKKLHSRPEL